MNVIINPAVTSRRFSLLILCFPDRWDRSEMPSTRSQKREKDDPSVEEVKEEPKGKKKKTKEAATKEKVEKVAEVESGGSKKKGKKQ